jgi:DNA helicase IV
VKDDEEIKNVTNALNNSHIFQNNNIKAEACVGEGEIGSASFVRVFNIKLIKGMEFETVFFMDVDEYSKENNNILDKLIYVGISRATYYLAVMCRNEIPESLAPIKDLMVNGNWDFDNYSDY